MGLDVASIGSTNVNAGPERIQRSSRTSVAAGRSGADSAAISSGDVPASPPPEVLEAIDAAGRAYRDLHARGRELRFVTGGEDGLRIEVRDLDGNVLRTIPPSELLDVATGAPLD